MGFVQFMSSTAGRALRFSAGMVMVIFGFAIGGVAGWVLGLVGLVPMMAGLTNTCLLAPLFGGPLRPAAHS